MKKEPRVIWVVPEKKGGISHYAGTLWPSIRTELARHGGFEPLEPIYGDLSINRIAAQEPALVHIQHEFGLFGSKLPPLYRFPGWIRKLRDRLPDAHFVATGHTILAGDYEYPVEGRGWQTPFRSLINRLWIDRARPIWLEGTWGTLDGVIVHSELQKNTLLENRALASEARLAVIPHFVPVPGKSFTPYPAGEKPKIVVFGYFTPEKGQDLAIEAFGRLKTDAELILAGGVRRSSDQSYLAKCRRLIEKLGLGGRVQVTGFVPAEKISDLYARATLVLAPFRETSGSGSLAQAFARKAAVLASDLPLNCEINLREPGALALFRTGDAADCARAMEELLASAQARAALGAAAARYAERCSPRRVAVEHVKFYDSVIGEEK